VIRAYSLVFQWADAAANVTGKVAIQAGGLDPAAMQQEPLVISLGTGIDNIPIKLRAVAAIAKVWDPETSTLRDVPVKNVDPNDRSVVLMLEYGSFRAFLGADIAGGNGTGNYAMNAASKKPFSQHGDVESVLMPVIKKIYPRTTQPQAGRPKFSIDGVSTVYRSAITAAPPATISIHWAGSPRALP
jgi:hypothetical protein